MSRSIGPDNALEHAALERLGRNAIICGVDEAGRGPLAGPVLAAAVVLAPGADIAGLNDSKQLSPLKRQSLFDTLVDAKYAGVVDIGIGAASVREIDALNILHANDLAMARAVRKLCVRPALALVDGKWSPRTLNCQVEPVVKGDSRSVSIAAASIVAKVVRDRIMARLAKRYPAFLWERNAGYPTASHRQALQAHGPCRHHRRSFRAVREAAEAHSLTNS